MDFFFVERTENGLYRIAIVDRHKIFNAENPGKLATTFDSSEVNPSQEDREQIFYAIGEAIGAFDFFRDVDHPQCNYKLNNWTVFSSGDTSTPYLSPLVRKDRLLLYSKEFSITPSEEELSIPLYLNLPTNAQVWKTGILQRCFKCLLKQEHYSPRICCLLDEQYRRIMRWKLETEGDSSNNFVRIINEITKLLGLTHSRDTTPFNIIPKEVFPLIEEFNKLRGLRHTNSSLDSIFNIWVNSNIVSEDGLFRLQINPDITEVLPLMVPMLICPDKLLMLEDPL